jgi:hypothetical protein
MAIKANTVELTEFLSRLTDGRKNLGNLMILAQRDEGLQNLPYKVDLRHINKEIKEPEVADWCGQAISRQHGLFVMTLTCDDSGKRKAVNTIDPLAIIADYDTKDGHVAPTDERLKELKLPPPTVRVQSGGGITQKRNAEKLYQQLRGLQIAIQK